MYQGEKMKKSNYRTPTSVIYQRFVEEYKRIGAKSIRDYKLKKGRNYPDYETIKRRSGLKNANEIYLYFNLKEAKKDLSNIPITVESTSRTQIELQKIEEKYNNIISNLGG